jgi:hypothetical protein
MLLTDLRTSNASIAGGWKRLSAAWHHTVRASGTICFADELADKRRQLRNIEATFRADIDPVESQAPAA